MFATYSYSDNEVLMSSTLQEYIDTLAWSRSQLAREARLDVGTVTRALRGEGRIQRHKAAALAQALSRGLGTPITFDQIEGLQVIP